jgi:hypothetical protein
MVGEVSPLGSNSRSQGRSIRKEVDPVAVFALLALIGVVLWATGHLIVR